MHYAILACCYKKHTCCNMMSYDNQWKDIEHWFCCCGIRMYRSTAKHVWMTRRWTFDPKCSSSSSIIKASSPSSLTHRGRDKRVDFSQTTFSNAFSSMKMLKKLIQIWLRFVPRCSFNDKSLFVSKMAWRRLGHKPLSKPMMTKFIDAYIRHSASMS